MFTNILCPVDFSKDSERALACALALARAAAGHLTLVTVVDPLLNAGAEAAGAAETLHQQTQQELQSLLERSAAAGPLPGVPAVAVRVGNAAREILTQAEESNADVIVMGMRGLGGAQKFLLGSTSQHVLERAAIPVLVVPPPDRR
ncbi:MAG: universal stress protein [Acidobacteria bacterium]|nr:universal stress protein [Acidobacteriota bacterium]